MDTMLWRSVFNVDSLIIVTFKLKKPGDFNTTVSVELWNLQAAMATLSNQRCAVISICMSALYCFKLFTWMMAILKVLYNFELSIIFLCNEMPKCRVMSYSHGNCFLTYELMIMPFCRHTLPGKGRSTPHCFVSAAWSHLSLEDISSIELRDNNPR